MGYFIFVAKKKFAQEFLYYKSINVFFYILFAKNEVKMKQKCSKGITIE